MTQQADEYARSVANYALLQEELKAAQGSVAELTAIGAAREQRITELESDRAKLSVERDGAHARLVELETQFRSFGALVMDALRQRERHGLPQLVIPEGDGQQAAA